MKIALIINQWGSFEVRVDDGYGNQRQLAYSESLDDCLVNAAKSLGHPLVIPISGPDSPV